MSDTEESELAAHKKAIRELIRSRGHSARSVSLGIGKSENYLAQYWQDKPEFLRPIVRHTLARFLGVNERELLEPGSRYPLLEVAPTVSSPPDDPLSFASIPIYGTPTERKGERTVVSFEPLQPVDYLERPPPLEEVRNAYATLVYDDRLAPYMPALSIAYINPIIPPGIDTPVVCRLRNGIGEIGMLGALSGDSVTLYFQDRDDTVTFASDDVEALHLITMWSLPFGRY